MKITAYQRSFLRFFGCFLASSMVLVMLTACVSHKTPVTNPVIGTEPEAASGVSETEKALQTEDIEENGSKIENIIENTELKYDLSKALDGSLMAYLTKSSVGSGYTLTVKGQGEMVLSDIPWDEYGDVITELILSEGLTRISENAFSDFIRLDTVTIPSSVTEIGASAFQNCRNMRTLTITSSVERIDSNAFDRCSSLETVCVETVENWLSVSFTDRGANPLSNGAELLVGGVALSELTLAQEIKSIGNYQFCGYDGLKQITISSAITHIGDGAFADCVNLDTLIFTGAYTEWQRISFGNGWSDGTIFRSMIMWYECNDKVCTGLDGVGLYRNMDDEAPVIKDLPAGTQLRRFATNATWDRVRYNETEYYVKSKLVVSQSDFTFTSITKEVKLEIKDGAMVKLRKTPFVSQESDRSEENVVLRLTNSDVTDTKPLLKVGESDSRKWYKVAYGEETYYLAYTYVTSGDVIDPSDEGKYGNMNQFG